MEAKEAAEILKRSINDPQLPEDLKQAIQFLAEDIDRMVPMIPFKGKQGSYMTYNCGFCHTGISDGSKFCYRCGRKVDLVNSDIPAIREEIIMDLPKEKDEIILPKKKRARDESIDGQGSFFDLIDQE